MNEHDLHLTIPVNSCESVYAVSSKRVQTSELEPLVRIRAKHSPVNNLPRISSIAGKFLIILKSIIAKTFAIVHLF